MNTERKPVDVRDFFKRVKHVRDNAIRGAHADTVSNVSTETVQRACDRIADHLRAADEMEAAFLELIESAQMVVAIDFGRTPLGRNARRQIVAISDRFNAAVARCEVTP